MAVRQWFRSGVGGVRRECCVVGLGRQRRNSRGGGPPEGGGVAGFGRQRRRTREVCVGVAAAGSGRKGGALVLRAPVPASQTGCGNPPSHTPDDRSDRVGVRRNLDRVHARFLEDRIGSAAGFWDVCQVCVPDDLGLGTRPRAAVPRHLPLRHRIIGNIAGVVAHAGALPSRLPPIPRLRVIPSAYREGEGARRGSRWKNCRSWLRRICGRC